MGILLIKILEFWTLFNKRLALFLPSISAKLFSVRLQKALNTRIT